jgi:hypothetical protein
MTESNSFKNKPQLLLVHLVVLVLPLPLPLQRA